MSNTIVFPTIKYLPRIVDIETFKVLDTAEDLYVVAEEKEYTKLLEQHPNMYKLHLQYIEELLSQNLLKQNHSFITNTLDIIRDKNEYALQIKLIDFGIYRMTNSSKPYLEKFEEIFALEIDALLHDHPYEEIVEDKVLMLFMKFLSEYCYDKGNKKGCEKLYEMAYNMRFEEDAIELAFIASQESYREQPDLGIEMDINVWYDQNETFLESNDINWKPYNSIFYKLLNRPIVHLTNEDIEQISNLKSDETILHDIRWLLHQGCLRLFIFGGKANYDFILQALYITVHYKVEEIAPLYTQLFTGMPSPIHEFIVGDFSGEFMLPWVYQLGEMSIEGWEELLTYGYKDDEFINASEFWYLKTTWLNCLAKLSTGANTQAKKARALLDKVWDIYRKKDNECLGWLMYYVNSYKLEGFDERIRKAYDQDMIELDVHGTYEEAISDRGVDFGKFVESYAPDDIGFSYIDDVRYIQELELKYERKIEKNVQKRMGLERKNRNSSISEFYENVFLNPSIGQHNQNDELADFDYVRYYHPSLGDDYISLDSDVPFVRRETKIGRNDPCPCNSGKKYKKCCMD